MKTSRGLSAFRSICLCFRSGNFNSFQAYTWTVFGITVVLKNSQLKYIYVAFYLHGHYTVYVCSGRDIFSERSAHTIESHELRLKMTRRPLTMNTVALFTRFVSFLLDLESRYVP